MSSSISGRKAAMRGSVSLLTLAVFAAAAPALAQADSQAMETVVVTGVRASLESAVNIKRNADTIVDSITATDIGVFPDKSVSDAIQRVPGITVSHLQSDDDTTHPSGEATGVLVRGLTFVRTNFNGRDSFSADGHRGLNVNDVSPEMIGGIDVYKNQTADMIEGGIAGTVDIRTRMPFDADDHILTGSVKMNYNDRADDVTYDYSGAAGKNFDTQYGRFGFLVGYANSHVVTQTNSVIMLRNGTVCSAGATNANGSAIVNSDGSIPCTANPYGGKGWVYLPDEVNYSRVNYNRKREGKSLELQWESPNKDLRWNFQYNESNYRNAWLEHSSNINLFGLWAAPGFDPMASQPLLPAYGTPNFTFNPNGTLRSGVLANPYGGAWMGSWGGTYQHSVDAASVVPGVPYLNYCGPQAGYTCANTATMGDTLENQSRVFDHSEGTRDLSTNLQWDVTDKVHATFDGQYISAKTGNNDMLVANDISANVKYERDGNGAPTITLLPPDNFNLAPGFLTNPHNYYSAFIQDHKERNNAQEIALKGDLQWDVDNGWLSYIKAGVRYANRKQVVRYSAYNWQQVADPYMCDGPGFSIDNTTPSAYPASCGNSTMFTGYGANIWYTQSLGNDFYNGKVFNPGATVWLKDSILKDPNATAMALGHKETGSPGSWDPICQRAGTTDCYLPSEVMDVTEKTTAGYLMVAFGGDSLALFGMPVSGNIGARYVKTELTSTGGVSYPANSWYANIAGSAAPCNAPLSGNNVTNISCWLTPGLGAFSNGGSGLNTYGKTSYNLLPSFNLKVAVSDDNILRFAVSEAMSRPDFGYLRNYVGITPPAVDTSSSSPYVTYNSPTAAHTPANVTGYNFVFIANAGNPALKPMTAWQYDATFEHYFSSVSSFTADVFLKELNNSISYGAVTRSITNNGATENILVRGPVNSANGGELWGFEVAYQAFFDFLPKPFDGLGTQLNYIHTHQAGIHNSNLAVQPGYIAGSTIAYGGGLQIDNAIIDSHRLSGISDDSYNIIALYEKGPIGFRLAYNWRSSFLTDNLDCCTGTPMFQKSAGFLDGSIRYSVDEHWEVSLDGSNLLDTPIVFQQQVLGDTSLSPNAKPVKLDTGWSRSGRLLQFAVRVKY